MRTAKPLFIRYLGGFPEAFIPAGTPVELAANQPPDEKGNPKYWAQLTELPRELREAYSQTGILLSHEDVATTLKDEIVAVFGGRLDDYTVTAEIHDRHKAHGGPSGAILIRMHGRNAGWPNAYFLKERNGTWRELTSRRDFAVIVEQWFSV